MNSKDLELGKLGVFELETKENIKKVYKRLRIVCKRLYI